MGLVVPPEEVQVSHVPRTVAVGCVAHPEWYSPAQFLTLARTAEAAGLDDLWLWEDCFKESGVAAAGAILGVTSRLRVGLGVLPAPLRNVALTAMEVATLDGMFPGRLIPGLGHGVQSWMEQVGGRVSSPLTLLREQVGALRALLHGERMTVAGRYVTLDDVALDWPPSSPPPVLAGGQGPKTLRLVGEVADGVVLPGGTSPGDLRRALELTAEGRALAGRTGPFEVCATVDLPPDVRAKGAQAAADYIRPWLEAGATRVPVLAGDHDLAATAWLGEKVAPLLRAV